MNKENAEKRDNAMQKIAWAMGTLRSAVRDINIGEDIPGCEGPVAVSRDIGKKQVERIRQQLAELEKLL
jgi:hypothetical protein